MSSIQSVLCKNPLNPHLFSELFLLSHHCTVQTVQSSHLAVSKGPQLFILPQTEALTAPEEGEGVCERKWLLCVFSSQTDSTVHKAAQGTL